MATWERISRTGPPTVARRGGHTAPKYSQQGANGLAQGPTDVSILLRLPVAPF